MSDDFMLNPSCSELVTYLGITEVDEIRTVLKDICQKFGYRIKLIPTDYDYLHNPGAIIDPKQIGINKDVRVLSCADLFLDPGASNLEKALDNRLITYDFYKKHKDDTEKLRNLVAFLSNKPIDRDQHIKLVLMSYESTYVEIQYQVCQGYDDTPGLTLQGSQSDAFNEYSILGNIYLLNPQEYEYKTFGEGNTSEFEEWLYIKTNKSEKELASWLEKKNYEDYYTKDFSFESQ